MGESSRFASKFSKTFSLDQTVDVDKFTATLKNGVLTVSAPKDLGKLEENVRRIPVVAAAADEAGSSNEKESKISSDEHEEEEEGAKSIDLDKDETSDNASKDDGKE